MGYDKHVIDGADTDSEVCHSIAQYSSDPHGCTDHTPTVKR